MPTTVKEIMADLQAHGEANIKKLLLKHGVKEPFFGVRIEHLQTIRKKIKKDYQLAKDLYATGNADAMYLAGLIADDEAMTSSDLQGWVKGAVSNNISEYTVPWVAAGGKHGFSLALKWIDSKEEHIAAAGWSTLSNLVALKPDTELDIPALKALLSRVVKTISTAGNRVRYTMNGFIISTGIYVTALTAEALATARKIGPVTIEMNGTACKVSEVGVYVEKARAKGALGKKKKMVKC